VKDVPCRFAKLALSIRSSTGSNSGAHRETLESIMTI
jgi:hypothetical protein